MEEFIRNITEQIRCVRAREAVAKELSDHILDQAAAYEKDGEDHEAAVAQAVRGMGDHDILGDRIAEIKYVIDQLPLLGLDHAALVAYIHIGFKFFLCNAEIVAVRADVQQPQDPVGDLVDHEDDGGQDAHQHTDDTAVEQGDPLGVLHEIGRAHV